MSYYVSHCESGSWALMQANPTHHIVDQTTATTLCGRVPHGGRWYGKPKLLTQHSFLSNDCEDCARQAAKLGIWTLPQKSTKPPLHHLR